MIRRILFLLISSLATTLSLRLDANAQDSASGEDRRVDIWVAAHRSEVLDQLLPPPSADEAVNLETAWVAVVRITPSDASADEVQIRIVQPFKGQTYARVTCPVDGSIRAQLRRIRTTHGEISPREAGALVQMRTAELSSSHRRRLYQLASELQRLRGTYVFPNSLMLDATRYELWTLGGAQQVYVTLLGPDSGKPTLPLLRWMLNLRELARCESRP